MMQRIQHAAAAHGAMRPARGPMFTAMAVIAIMLSGVSRLAADTVVIVLSSNASSYLQAEQAMAETLAARGHTVRLMSLEDASDAALQRLLESGVNSFVAIGGDAAVAVRGRLPDHVPLSFCMVADAEGVGLTPSTNAYGASTDVPIDVQLELIAEALPRARTLGMLYRGKDPRSAGFKRSIEDELPPGWTLVAVDVDENQSIAQAIDSLLSRPLDVVWTAADASVYDDAAVRSLLLAAVRRRVPVYGFSQALVRSGALLGAAVDPACHGRRAAVIAQRLLDADEPPIAVSPANHRIAVNLAVADMLSIELPRPLILRATYVVRGE